MNIITDSIQGLKLSNAKKRSKHIEKLLDYYNGNDTKQYIEKMFSETIDDLYKKFGEDVLKINMTDIMQAQKNSGAMHG